MAATVTPITSGDTTSLGTTRRDAANGNRGSRLRFGDRIAVLVALFLCAYGVVFAQVLRDAVNGSRSAFLVTAPLLVVLAATGYRSPTRGVGDHESDWIVGALTGGAGFASIAWITNRFPTLAGFWHLELITGLVWVACSGMILFGVRHTLRMWPVWLFAFGSALTLPYLLLTAALGGSDFAAALIAVTLGSAVVFLAGRPMPPLWGITAAALTMAIGAVLAAALIEPLGLCGTVLIAGGGCPTLAVIGLNQLSARTSGANPTTAADDFHPVSRRSQVILALAAVALLTTQLPIQRQPTPPRVYDDWIQRSGLVGDAQFGFITRFLGPEATLIRYEVAPAKAPAAAVDVITTTNLATLQTYSDAIWYPSPTPVDFIPAQNKAVLPNTLHAKVVHSNADATTSSAAQNWYAVSWIWRTASVYQQVTVIVNQATTASAAPAEPIPLSLIDTAVKPALWVGRQQPDRIGTVDPRVTKRANDIIQTLISALVPARAPVFESPRG